MSETAFNVRLNNHRNDVYKTNIPRQTNILDYLVTFNQHAKFTLIKQSNNTECKKELLSFGLKKCNDFWINKLKYEFNAELNFPNP